MTALLNRIDRLQQRHPTMALPVAVLKRFAEHGGGRLAATVSYYSFFSVFPLLLALVTVLGLVLDNNPDLRADLVDGALGQIPVVGAQIADAQSPLTGSVVILVIGLAAAVWAGLGAVGALQQGLDELADVPMHRRPKFIAKRLKAVFFLLAFAVGLAASTLLSNLTTLFDVGPGASALGLVATALTNTALLLAMFAVLPAERRPWRTLLPGAVMGGVVLSVLQLLGGLIVERYLSGADPTYGTFAGVIALLSWFHLVGRMILLAAETNGVLARGLWPRSIAPGASFTAADRKATLLDVSRVQRDRRVGFAISMDGVVTSDDEVEEERDQVDTSR